MTATVLPKYAELPTLADTGERHCWGLFGASDELGALNRLTNGSTLAAVQEVTSGKVIPLSLPLDHPQLAIASRTPHRLNVVTARTGRSESLDGLFTQYSSQWDGLRHIRFRQHGYFGGRDEETLDQTEELGIDRIAAHGIVTRGLFVDVPRYMQESGRAWDPSERIKIGIDVLEEALSRHGLTPREGDVLLVRTGWLAWHLRRATSGTHILEASAGLDPSRQMAAWLWDNGIVAVAADNIALEVMPFERSEGWLHSRLIALLGILIGELWQLDELAIDCAMDGRYSGLLVSAPLMLPRGAGSPANAYMIK